ncbi:MAG: glycosyltransferase [Caldilineaceae bacterium]|nr:glycosyltransferase [Caldilineaceae bacterium]
MPLPQLVFVCGREPDYIRNAMIAAVLAQHYPTDLIADSRRGSLSLRLARLAPRLIRRLRRPHDLIVVGFYGHPLVLLARRFSRAPILFDPFVSTYDTLVGDRGRIAEGSLAARALQTLDRSALEQATLNLSDTQAHAAYYAAAFGVPPEKLATLYLGCNEAHFFPRPAARGDRFVVFSYSTYLPLHGMTTIVEAAQRCLGYPIEFRLVGSSGPTLAEARARAQSLGLTNVSFVPSLPFAVLPEAIAAADLCLGGHFGTSAKSRRVIAGKSYQFIAMGKPVILADNAANRELFDEGVNAAFCPPGDPDRLAQTILALYHAPDLRRGLAENALGLYRRRLTWQRLGADLLAQVQRLL